MQTKHDHARRLGARLRIARSHRSAERIALGLGVPVEIYTRWETGDSSFPSHLIARFCELTSSSPGFIVSGVPDEDWPRTRVETGVFLKHTPPQDIYDTISSILPRIEDELRDLDYQALDEFNETETESFVEAAEHMKTAWKLLRGLRSR